MNDDHSIDPRLVNLLENLRETEPREAHRASLQRTSFLSEAEQLTLGVSQPRLQRLNRVKAAFNKIFVIPRKESFPMFRTVMAFVVLAGLVFGGSTVAVAQSSLPDEALYPVKIWTEDVRISFAGNEEAQFNLTWDFANRRLGEIQTLLNTGAFIPEPVMTRLETQLDDSLTHAANLPDDQAMVALLQVQTQLQQQKQTISQFQFQTEASPAMLQIRERIQNTLELHLGLAQGGAGDPQWLREQLRIRRQEHNNHGEPGGGNPWTTGTPTPGSGYGPGESQNPWTTGTPTPGSGYGPGESQNPWTTGTPTPGSGYGPGPGNNPGSTPPSDGSSDGSGPCDSCGNGSGGNGNKP